MKRKRPVRSSPDGSEAGLQVADVAAAVLPGNLPPQDATLGAPAAGDFEAGRLLDRWGQLEQEISTVRAERDRLRAQADSHREELAAGERSVATYRSQVEALQEEIAVTRRRLEQRTAALNGSGAGRGSADRRLADYRDALLGMEHTLAEREQVILRHATEKAEFAARIAELERQCAEVTGRWRESEAANGRLQAMLTEAARASERLDGEARQARENAACVARQVAEIATLQDELKAKQASSSRNETRLREQAATLRTEQDRNAGLQARMREQDEALGALQAALERERAQAQAEREQRAAEDAQRTAGVTKAGGERQASKAVRAELTAAREELARRDTRIAELEARATKLAGDAAATENVAGMAIAARDRIADELQEKLAVIATLESRAGALAAELEMARQAAAESDSELRRQQNSLAVLGREVERLEAIETSAQRRDEIAARHAMVASDADRRRKARLIVSLEGDHNIKYPLYKQTMIIGRSSDADIHVIGRFTSRRHARVVILEDETAVIEDLGSLNGIRVNDEAVTRHVLHDGDLLDVGGARLQFVDLGERETARSNTG